MNFYDLPKRQVKLIKSLRDSRNSRRNNKLFFVEGSRSVCEAVESDYDLDFIVVSDGFLHRYNGFFNKLVAKLNSGIRVYKTSKEIYESLSDTVSPQGILAVVKIKSYQIEDIPERDFLVVALDRIKDPGNMGTIIRTADAAGASAIVTNKGCVDIFNPKVIRSTMGSIFHLPFVEVEDLTGTLMCLKRRGGRVVATHLKAERCYYDVDYTKPMILVMGKEDEGVSREILEISDEVIKIPMPGKAESLNVSVANGIVLFEAVKQRLRAHPFACK
ncbi:23S rRNA (guanosine(2251)-2'-O)-methyltransferase RlmB [Thermoanaerobacterium sp. DL9XJH110]|uniref:23S rRNA (guanosine(2251)-2'-O)-methyltransferase RlmB n=1 Tax=Thermoanaerobacterium sp. DL9XJH110 TaxID=3386643 RepID=UPI003BB578E8